MPNWKSPGPDGVQGYWIKNLANAHEMIAHQLDKCLQENNMPLWMGTGKTLLCVKEVDKGISWNFGSWWGEARGNERSDKERLN